MKPKIHEYKNKHLVMSKAQVNEIKKGLQHFSGTDMFYQIPLTRTRFTNGIKYLAEAAECFWLVTDTSIIAKSLMHTSYFITIDFKRLSEEDQQKLGCQATITYGDGNGIILEKHKYRATDFPLDELRLYFIDNTLLLPSEY